MWSRIIRWQPSIAMWKFWWTFQLISMSHQLWWVVTARDVCAHWFLHLYWLCSVSSFLHQVLSPALCQGPLLGPGGSGEQGGAGSAPRILLYRMAQGFHPFWGSRPDHCDPRWSSVWDSWAKWVTLRFCLRGFPGGRRASVFSGRSSSFDRRRGLPGIGPPPPIFRPPPYSPPSPQTEAPSGLVSEADDNLLNPDIWTFQR